MAVYQPDRPIGDRAFRPGRRPVRFCAGFKRRRRRHMGHNAAYRAAASIGRGFEDQRSQAKRALRARRADDRHDRQRQRRHQPHFPRR